jgi:phosphoribosylformylglycinamidine (FGAM) synthase-like amidotransferase family enzyme
MNTEKPPIPTERVMMLITLVTVFIQGGFYLLSGGFSIGDKLSGVTAEIKLLRQEVAASNQIQDYRLDKLEASLASEK